ncbi:MAG: GNAT family N-acetyltransferase [Acidobacteria bacterium]|jgi:ribosomal protein S18 acetylase RimI-like enzyme|nr:GNAT family N-acetyltransferase [Acidobacteriota bacterium]
MPSSPESITIVTFRPEHAEAFYRLNRAWLDEHGLYEPADEVQLADPQGAVIDAGGTVFIAERGGMVVGTAAIAPHGPGEVELLKVTVADAARGAGLGRSLVDVCIARAREMGAHTVILVSSSRLQPALRLYERMGFTHRPMPSPMPYATADVCMELHIPVS